MHVSQIKVSLLHVGNDKPMKIEVILIFNTNLPITQIA
jgi:hypothetical protein